MNSKPDDEVIYKCKKCGEEALGDVHLMPEGWIDSLGDEFCDKCVADIDEAMKLHESGRNDEARAMWNRRLKEKLQ